MSVNDPSLYWVTRKKMIVEKRKYPIKHNFFEIEDNFMQKNYFYSLENVKLDFWLNFSIQFHLLQEIYFKIT